MFEIQVDTREFETAAMRLASMESTIETVAENNGFRYFWAVDRGRGPVRPIHAKALRIMTKEGPIFRRYAGPAPAQHLTEKSLGELMPSSIVAAETARGTSFIVWARQFLGYVANFQSRALARVTPRGFSGKLGNSYRVHVKG